MPIPSSIADLSQTAGSNYPSGSESPSTIDDYFRAHASFIAQLRDGKGATAEAEIASAATVDIGAANSPFVKITGTTAITSLGSNYTGLRILRFTGALVLTHNATSLILPGAANYTTRDGMTCIAVPNGNPATGWRIHITDFGYQASGSGATIRTIFDKLRDSVSVKDFGAVGDGVTDDSAAIQAALDAVSSAGGGVVYAPPGNWFIGGDAYINIKAGVTLRGAGSATRFISGTGGKNGHHVFVYLKDGSAIEDCRLSGSGYARQSGGANYAGYNKIGISTQGAATGKNFRVSRVGFEKFLTSYVFVFDNHSDALIEGCYTFGTQIGKYVEVDANYLVTNWNATSDSTKLTAGTQVYCLSNFYNSGSGGTADVTICGGRFTNINDAFVGVNGTCKRHVIANNVFVKNATGYYGGYGVDLAGGDECVVTGNFIEGATAGAHLYGSTNCTVTGNTFKADLGVWIQDPTALKNSVVGNTIYMTSINSGISNKTGVLVSGGVNNTITANTIDGQSIAGSRGVYFETQGSGAVGNAVNVNTICNTATGIESADASNDGNFSNSNIFRSVTTQFPRAINSNYLQNVKGISGVSTNANNLGGNVTISNTATSATVTLTNAEPDTQYKVLLAIRSFGGTPAAGAYTITGISSVTTTSFNVNVSAAPGSGNSVSITWLLFRA